MSFKNENVELGDMKKLAEIIKDIDIAMLTTVDEKGFLRSRPMATQEMAADGTLYFFMDTSSPKVEEISSTNQVNLVYSQPDDHRYVSISGRAVVNKNKAKMKELWKPTLKAWFPEGLEDPTLGLLQVTVEQAEYWDYAGTVTEVIGLAKALTTGHTYEGAGVHGRINNT
ncbi:MAG: pyridoxamine 5'-phosphate oxidase family protein [Bdellovibrio sp.]|nr:pyridoxamine 5'-phosphate oxidase family protein [Bdellovibrio sp.]